MAKQTVFLGSSVNDGTGDSIRASFDKVNDNFDEVYAVFPTLDSANLNATVANTLFYGNSTVNAVANSIQYNISDATSVNFGNSSTWYVGNSTVNVSSNSSTFKIGANVSGNTLALKINAAVGNAVVNATMMQVQNSSSVANLTASALTIGTAVVNATVVQTASANISTNTFTFGTSSIAANGYSRLPNGLLLQWGTVSSNSSVGNITFPALFTAVYSVQVTPCTATYSTTYSSILIASNTSTANVRTGNTTSINVTYMAIGT